MTIKSIGIVGAGTMGSGISQIIAKAGYQVVIRDIKSDFVENGIKKIEKSLDRNIKKDKITEKEKDNIMQRIKGTTDVIDLQKMDIIIEAVNENMKLKKDIFRELDDICDESTILVSNTSALSITEIASVTARPEKVMGVHFFNPVSVMKLVELINGINTSDKTFSTMEEFINSLDKTTIEAEESPGFVVNRILVPMINEAVFLLDEGTASAKDIDKGMKLGANHPIGPLALGDLVGLDVCLAIMETFYEEFGDPKYRPSPLLRKKVRAGQLGRKTGEGFFKYN